MATARRFWMFGISSPLIYLIICLVIDRWVFLRRPTSGFWPMSPDVFTVVFGVLATLAVLSMPILHLLRTRWVMRSLKDKKPGAGGNGRQPEDEPPPDPDHTDWIRGRRFLFLFMACDFVAVVGLILFLLQGRMSVMLFFGVVALFDYAIAYPGRVTGERR